MSNIIEKKNLKLSPLADPVISAIFANEEVAGLAAESLIRATLKAGGSRETDIGQIISVTSQRSYIDAITRSCRVDVETKTNANKVIIYEVQLAPDLIIMQRNLLASSHIYAGTSKKGDTAEEMARDMPKVIFINILNYNIREDNKEVLQPFGIMYTKPPIVTAVPNFEGYNVQLPRLLEMEADFKDGFFCWYYTMYMAHKNKITVEEVLAMSPQLQAYAEQDKGYMQFCDQYKYVSADPKTRDEYFWWLNGQLRSAGEKLAAEEIGVKKGIQQGIQQGVQQGVQQGIQQERKKAEKEMFDDKRSTVLKMTKAGMDDVTIADMLNFSVSDIGNYR